MGAVDASAGLSRRSFLGGAIASAGAVTACGTAVACEATARPDVRWSVASMPEDEATFVQQIESARSGGVGALLMSLGTAELAERIQTSLSSLRRRLQAMESAVLAQSHSVLAETTACGRIAVIACAGAAPLYRGNVFSAEVDGLVDLRAAGIGVMGLAYDWRGLCADGALEHSDLPLTALGVSAVQKMNEAGILINLAHCGRRSSLDAIATSARSVIFSHAGAAAILNHPAHLTDEQIRACAARGGVIGVSPQSTEEGTTAALLRHLDYLLDLAGIDHVGLASGDIGAVSSHLSARALTAGQIAQVTGGNFRRLFEQVWRA